MKIKLDKNPWVGDNDKNYPPFSLYPTFLAKSLIIYIILIVFYVHLQHCDCDTIYLARFLREHFKKLWNGMGGVPICLGPGMFLTKITAR